MACRVEKCCRSVEVVLVFLLKLLHDACPIPVQSPPTDCVCAVCHHSWKKDDLACWFAERAALPLVCACAVKPET